MAFTLAQNLGNFGNVIHASASASVTLLPELNIVKSVNGPTVIHPGDTASFTITVSNTGAGPATHVVVTDQLPEEQLLTWTAPTGHQGFASYKVADGVTSHKAVGLGVYSVFGNYITEQNAIEAPTRSGIALSHMVTVSLASGQILNIINDSGGSVGNGQFNRFTTY